MFVDERIGNARSAAGLVSVPSRARLLAVAAHFVEAIGNGGLRSLGPRLPDRFQVLADAPADVDAGDVLHPERSHRIAEVGERVVDLRDAGAFLEQQVRLAHVVREHAVGDESETVADDHANLVQLLRELQRRRDHLRAGRAPADDLEQLHHVGRAEEVVPDDLCRPAARRGELVDVERRRVRRENGVGPCHRGELGERGLLQVHVLEHGLDDDVDVTEAVVARRRRNERQCARHRLRRHPALRHRRLVVLANDATCHGRARPDPRP